MKKELMACVRDSVKNYRLQNKERKKKKVSFISHLANEISWSAALAFMKRISRRKFRKRRRRQCLQSLGEREYTKINKELHSRKPSLFRSARPAFK